MDSIASFLAMGGYAVYVWPAIGLTAAVMAVLAWLSWRGLRQAERAVSDLERDLGRRDGSQAETEAEADGAS